MTFPLYTHGLFGAYAGLLVGALVGIAFGFVLERAGFGRARNLAAQFYLTDLRVLKVMFSAIVTALVGMTFLAGIGVLDLSESPCRRLPLAPARRRPASRRGLHRVGLLPGHGRRCDRLGNLDGLAAIGGVMLGSLAFGAGYGPLEGFYESGAMGAVRIDGLLGVPPVVARPSSRWPSARSLAGRSSRGSSPPEQARRLRRRRRG